ncbi:MAG: IS3 family transposase [Candidatus Cloacimonetes bacterium]|nr:IS3 family transposase [Candidatus Cloacimonadota bacterium]
MVSKTFSGKYRISSICKILDVPRSTYYYHPVESTEDEEVIIAVKKSFAESHGTYGTPRIRADLKDLGHNVSRLRIGRIMASNNLVSCYTKKKSPTFKRPVNNEALPNLVSRQFKDRKKYEVLVSDTTYIDINKQWHYLCPVIDLSRRTIVGSCVSSKRDTSIAVNSLYSVDFDLRKTKIFHTDRGSEFNSKSIDDILAGFDIQRSLSAKGSPIDNAVVESFFKTVKIEFINRNKFDGIESFRSGWEEYVHWYNYKRRHSSLGYRPPIDPIKINTRDK